MKRIMLGLLAITLTTQITAQITKTEQLSEVTVYAPNYKYLKSLNSEEPAPVSAEMLQRQVAAFNLKDSKYYEEGGQSFDPYGYYQDDYPTYHINFYIPDGYVLAAYDNDGKIIRTAERFENVALPPSVREAIAERFPEWKVTKDVYRVHYHEDHGVTKKYKVKLENGDKTIRVKLDEKGNFI